MTRSKLEEMSLGEHLKNPSIQKYNREEYEQASVPSMSVEPMTISTTTSRTGKDLERDIGIIANLMSMADRDVRKSWARVEKVLKQRQRPSRKSATPHTMSPQNALIRTRPLTDACAQFYGAEEASRVDLTRMFSRHIKEKDLRNPDNHRYFTLDPEMQAALGTQEVECTWTKLPALLKNCFSE